MNIIEELQQYQAALGEHVKTLEAFKAAQKEHDLHIIPVLHPGGVVLEVTNFGASKDQQPAKSTVEGVPAALFYEVYREALPILFTEAIVKAQNSVEVKKQELRTKLDSEERALAAAKKALADFDKPASGKKAAAPR